MVAQPEVYDSVHAEKHRLPGETFSQAMDRISNGLADNPGHRRVFRDILEDQRFLPAGRIQVAIGAPKDVTPYNCYVASTIHDSFVHGEDNRGRNSIMDVARQAASTMRMGGGIGYDWSTLRPSSDIIHGVQSTTDGPIAFMPIVDAVCRATSSAGNRRGAQMAVLRVDHPDILNYIRCKQPPASVQPLWEHVQGMEVDDPRRDQLFQALQATLPLTGFNISVAITDEFMECLASGRPFPLRFGGRVYSHVDPVELWELLMRSTWDWAEPGVLFIDTINRMNNLWYCETIAATNPCGEQPLPPNGACLLGSFNLARYIHGFVGNWSFDWAQLATDIPAVVRAMDNVVDVAIYPLPAQRDEALSKRRMGLGIAGLANAAEALGFSYGSRPFLEFEAKVLETIAEVSYETSAQLAAEKGSFPLFDADQYLKSRFVQERLSDTTRRSIAQHGIRNSHLTSIAPTGTISFTAGNISSGIEPVIMYEGHRWMNRVGQGRQLVPFQDYGVEHFKVYGQLASNVSAQSHVGVLVTAAQRVDSAVSKTCNVSPDMPWEDFKDIYKTAYEGGAKGCTTYNPGGRRAGIFVKKERPVAKAPVEALAAAACEIDLSTGRRSCE